MEIDAQTGGLDVRKSASFIRQVIGASISVRHINETQRLKIMPTKKKIPSRKTATKAKPAKTAKKTVRKATAKPAVKKVKRIPDGMTAITPHLVCAGAADAIEFYKRAFNAVEEARLPASNGKIMHAQVRIGGAAVMLVDEMREWGIASPKTLNGSPVSIHLYVDDADATVAQAVEAGAKIVMPLSDMFWGDRYGKLEDPFGHLWSIGTHLRDVSPEEVQQAMEAM